MNPSITYDLSNRQIDILRRGTCLLIALPTPPEPIRDPMRFAQAALPEYASYIVTAQEQELAIWPHRRRTELPANLTEYIGGIPPHKPDGFSVSVGVVIAKIQMRPHDKKVHKVMWANNYFVDGVPQLPFERYRDDYCN